MATAAILDQYGKPIVRQKPKRSAADATPIHARYDAAQTTNEFKNYWAAADAFDAALDLLEAHGWTRPTALFRPELARQVHKGQNLQRGVGNLDLHRAVVRPPHHLQVGDAPFRRAPLAVDGVDYLDHASLAVAASLDLVLGDRVLKPWAIRDVMQAVSAVPDVDTLAVAEQWDVTEFVALAIDTAGHLLDVPDRIPTWVAHTPLSTETERMVMRFREGSSAGYHLMVARRLPSWSDRWRYLRTYLPTVAQLRRHRLRDLVRRELDAPESGR